MDRSVSLNQMRRLCPLAGALAAENNESDGGHLLKEALVVAHREL